MLHFYLQTHLCYCAFVGLLQDIIAIHLMKSQGMRTVMHQEHSGIHLSTHKSCMFCAQPIQLGGCKAFTVRGH